MQNKHYKEALSSIDKALLAKPLHSTYLLLKAKILEALKNYHEALRLLGALKQSDKSLNVEDAYKRVKTLLKANQTKGKLQLHEAATEDVHESYISWIKSLGIKFTRIELRTFAPNYRGIVATRAIDASEVVVAVPKEAIITVRMGKETEVGKKLVESGATLMHPNNSFLSIYVLIEKANPKTRWRHLLHSFPESVANFPIFFTKAERKLLAGSSFLAKIKQLKDAMKKDYSAISRAAPEFASMASLNDFMRTRALVNSRIFGLTVDSEPSDSLVPFADMFNHKYRNKMTHWGFDEKSSAFVVRAQSYIQAGSEIFVYYGSKPNQTFFQFYGFVVENNENDEVYIKVCANPGDKLIKLKESMLCKKYTKFKVTKNTEDSNFAQLMSLFRFLAFEGTPEELLKVALDT